MNRASAAIPSAAATSTATRGKPGMLGTRRALDRRVGLVAAHPLPGRAGDRVAGRPGGADRRPASRSPSTAVGAARCAAGSVAPLRARPWTQPGRARRRAAASTAAPAAAADQAAAASTRRAADGGGATRQPIRGAARPDPGPRRCGIRRSRLRRPASARCRAARPAPGGTGRPRWRRRPVARRVAADGRLGGRRAVGDRRPRSARCRARRPRRDGPTARGRDGRSGPSPRAHRRPGRARPRVAPSPGRSGRRGTRSTGSTPPGARPLAAQVAIRRSSGGGGRGSSIGPSRSSPNATNGQAGAPSMLGSPRSVIPR